MLLFLVNEIVLVGGAWLMDGRWTRSWRLRGLLLLSAVFASLTPQARELRRRRRPWPALPYLLQLVLVPAMAAVALAGLWAQTFLLTGVALDAMRGRRPTYEASVRHWREGALKGGVYSAVFMLLVQLAAGIVDTPAVWSILSAVPLVSATLARRRALSARPHDHRELRRQRTVLPVGCAPTPPSRPATGAVSWSAAASASR